jgi:hypothetical protein
VREIKHDGYRLIIRRDGNAVCLFTRRGYDSTERYPAIGAAACGPGRSPSTERLWCAGPTVSPSSTHCTAGHGRDP